MPTAKLNITKQFWISELNLCMSSFFPIENAVIGAGTVSKVPNPKTPPTNPLRTKQAWQMDFLGRVLVGELLDPDAVRILVKKKTIIG